MAKIVPDGYMTLKVELAATKIVRTIVVPEHMTLEDLHDAIQAVMGWEDAHLWHFTDRRRDGVIYELPHEDDGFPSFSKRLTIDASKMTLRKVLPNRGAKLYYEYDFGDGWQHVITRQADPKTPEIACVKSSGPDGIEDFGGQWRLAAFIEAMRTNPESEEYAETREWASLDTAEDLKKYLDGESLGQKTKKLRRALSHVKPPVQDAAKQEKPMTEEEKANVLGMIFARLVNAQLWQILDKAMRNGGTCEFEDPNKDIGEFFLTMFEGLKVKDGRSSLFYTDPSRLTVLPEWVEMYKKHGKEWGQLHEQFDILESYASSAVRLYGSVSLAELREIILRYDPGCTLGVTELSSVLEARAIHCPKMPYRIVNELVVSEDIFPSDIEDIDAKVAKYHDEQSEFPRWYPQTRAELFKYEDLNGFDSTPESDTVEHLLKTIFKNKSDYDHGDALLGIYHTLKQSLHPDTAYDLLLKNDILPKLSDKTKRELLDAMDSWSEGIRMPLLNGNTVRELRTQAAQQPKMPNIGRNDPCPCGSGKKFKHCCGDFTKGLQQPNND